MRHSCGLLEWWSGWDPLPIRGRLEVPPLRPKFVPRSLATKVLFRGTFGPIPYLERRDPLPPRPPVDDGVEWDTARIPGKYE